MSFPTDAWAIDRDAARPTDRMTAGPRTARIDRARAALAGSLESSTARPASRRWAMENFRRGLRLGRELQALVGPLAGRRLLEIGTAYAGDLTALHALGVSCVGTDHVVMNFPDLRRRLGDPPDFSFVRCSCMRRWPFADASFDLLLCMEVIEFVEDLDGFFSEVCRVLRPDGVAVLTTPAGVRLLRHDPIYRLPVVGILPNRLRCWIAERLCGRGTDWRPSRHSLRSAGSLQRYVRRHRRRVTGMKFADSPIMARIRHWPAAGLLRRIIRQVDFDYLLLQPVGTG